MTVGIVGMSLAFAVAGVLQAYVERVQGQPYMFGQEHVRFWMFVVFLHGLIATVGVGMTVTHLLGMKGPKTAV